jgi:hypothetical protein
MPQSYTIFKGVTNISETHLTEILKTNFYFLLNWGFLEIGGYFNVRIPTSGAYGGADHRLRPIKDPNFTNGSVWGSFHGQWVWESGTVQPDQPIRVSGVYINGNFTSVNYVDYANGRVILNSGISTNSVVTAEYSYRYANIYPADDIPWLRTVQYNTFRSDSDQYMLFGSGTWGNIGNNSVHLPAVIYEVQDGHFEPYALGGGTKAYNEILFHVVAEDGVTADRIADILANQYEKTMFLFDVDYLANSGVFPLDHLGRLNDGAKTYPQLVEAKEDGGFRWRKFTIEDTTKQPRTVINNNLYDRTVRMTTSTVLTSI